MSVARHLVIRGRVQGVGYRYFIYNIADNLGLTGYAKNLFNGDVEIYAEGNLELLKELVKKAKEGPSGAHVEKMNTEWLEFKNKYSNFETK